MVKPAAKREGVEHLRQTYDVGLRRACGLAGLGTSSYYYKPAERRDETPLRRALKEAAAQRPRMISPACQHAGR